MVSINKNFQQEAAALPYETLAKAFAKLQPGSANGLANGHAKKAQAIANTTGSAGNQAVVALDSLASLIGALTGEDDGAFSIEGPETESYEQYGHPDPFQALLAILDRPVGMGVVRKSRTVSVVQADGSVTTEVQSSAQYVQRQYTGEELVYLDQQDRARGKRRARVGEMDYTLNKK